MVALPVLAGALLRVVFGMLVDRLRPRLAGIIGQIIVIAGLTAAWLVGIETYQGTLTLGLVLGVAGASFAVALPLASRWYPPQYQGTALGIAGAGNPAPCSPRCSRRASPRWSAGTTCSASP